MSHIFPEFFYRDLYDEKHRAVSVTPATNRTRWLQKGLRQRLLCAQCEAQLSRYETYAATTLRKLQRIPGPDTPGSYLELCDVDYARFKLFQLSLLWRVSVSNDPAFCGVSVGPHEEKVRRHLVQDDPGEQYDYMCLLATLRRPHRLGQMLPPPREVKLRGHRTILMVAAGLFWLFKTSHHVSGFPFAGDAIGPGRPLRVGILSHSEQDVLEFLGREMEEGAAGD